MYMLKPLVIYVGQLHCCSKRIKINVVTVKETKVTHLLLAYHHFDFDHDPHQNLLPIYAQRKHL